MEVTAGLSIPKAEPARRRPGWLIDYGERALLIPLTHQAIAVRAGGVACVHADVL